MSEKRFSRWYRRGFDFAQFNTRLMLDQLSPESQKIAALTEELTTLKLTVTELEKERDFYFGKLRDIEITCQTTEKTEVTQVVEDIQKILYSSEMKSFRCSICWGTWRGQKIQILS